MGVVQVNGIYGKRGSTSWQGSLMVWKVVAVVCRLSAVRRLIIGTCRMCAFIVAGPCSATLVGAPADRIDVNHPRLGPIFELKGSYCASGVWLFCTRHRPYRGSSGSRPRLESCRIFGSAHSCLVPFHLSQLRHTDSLCCGRHQT